MTARSDYVKVGERLQISRDQHGNPVLEFDRNKKEYIVGKLQWFEVVAVEEGDIKLKPVWP